MRKDGKRDRRRKTNKEFIEEIKDLVGDEYTVLGKYKGSRKHVKIRHNKCGHEYDVTPTGFKSGSRCRKCSIREQRKTNEEFVKEVNDIVGEEYIFLEDYKDTKTKLKIIHNTCGRVYKTTPRSFLSGSRCRECYFRRISKTEEDFLKELGSLVGEEYTILGEYEGYTKHIKIRHNECGHEYDVVPSRFINGNRCLKCRGRSQRKTNEEFLKEVKDLVGYEYNFLEEYQTAVKKIKVRHNKCKREYYVTPNNFLRGNRCKECSVKRRVKESRKTDEEFTTEVYALVGYEYTFLEEYEGTETNILCRHSTCGHEWSIRPANFLNGTRCPQCKNKKPMLTQEEYEQRVYDLVGDEYSVLGEYKGHRNRVLMKHNKCGNEYTVVANIFLADRGCPECASSLGERRIRRYLERNNIPFGEEQTFEGLKYINSLRYDFSILDESRSVIALIEFDGVQHKKPIDFFGGEEHFKLTKKRDNIKNEYAKENNIPLIRIPYKEINNVEGIVEEFLNNNNII